MLKYRAISFPLILAIFFAMIFWQEGGVWIFNILCCAMIFGVTWDLAKMLGNIKIQSHPIAVATLTTLSTVLVLQSFNENMLSWLFTSISIAIFGLFWGLLRVVGSTKPELDFRKYFTSIAIYVMVMVIFLPLIFIYNSVNGAMFFMYLVLVTKSMDTGGYIFGMTSAKLMPNGNHKILPKISPKKSWEGTIGGIIFAVLVSLIFYWCGCFKEQNLDIIWFIVFGVVLSLGSFVGDLTESALKRICQVKDSGNYIPGMGGVFDILDSFIYNGMIFFYITLVKPWTF